jgi:hypothetical protein
MTDLLKPLNSVDAAKLRQVIALLLSMKSPRAWDTAAVLTIELARRGVRRE